MVIEKIKHNFEDTKLISIDRYVSYLQKKIMLSHNESKKVQIGLSARQTSNTIKFLLNTVETVFIVLF